LNAFLISARGRDQVILDAIADAVRSVEGVTLLDVDPGKATNRTVFTFVGHPKDVINAAFEAIGVAGKLIDMTKHKGEHPRMGATDVCPLIPISGITIEELVPYAQELGRRVAEHHGIRCIYMKLQQRLLNARVLETSEVENMKVLPPRLSILPGSRTMAAGI
jgi:glutamate formiminotransferase/formiminotetrahydrofolate cyclodeaminase